jgi:hypothetical protein
LSFGDKTVSVATAQLGVLFKKKVAIEYR